MQKLLVSKKKAKIYSFILFLVGLAVLSYADAWWPGIMLVIGIPLALRQYMLGHTYDMCVTLVVFVGVFLTAIFSLSERFMLLVLFTIGAIYLFFREYFDSTTPSEEELEEDLNEEIEEDQHDKKQ